MHPAGAGGELRDLGHLLLRGLLGDHFIHAQGVGNLLCGAAGALPMTGVIVRSSANVQAGATTRLSAILHGVWILGFVALLPWLLREIPMAALGAVLVVTGARLVNFNHAKHLFKDYGVLPVLIWAVTLTLVVAEDLLTGVLVGIALSLLELIPHLRKLKLKVDDREEAGGRTITLDGAATFVTLPKLSAKLDAVPGGAPVRLDLTRCSAVDHTCAELLRDWCARRRASGSEVALDGGFVEALGTLKLTPAAVGEGKITAQGVALGALVRVVSSKKLGNATTYPLIESTVTKPVGACSRAVMPPPRPQRADRAVPELAGEDHRPARCGPGTRGARGTTTAR